MRYRGSGIGGNPGEGEDHAGPFLVRTGVLNRRQFCPPGERVGNVGRDLVVTIGWQVLLLDLMGSGQGSC